MNKNKFFLFPFMKKASAPVPIVILVIGTIVVCILIILMLFFKMDALKKEFVGPGIIESISSLERDLHLDQQLDNFYLNKDVIVVLNLRKGEVNLFDKNNQPNYQKDFKEYLIMSEGGKKFEAQAGFKKKFVMLGFIRIGEIDLPLVQINYTKQ